MSKESQKVPQEFQNDVNGKPEVKSSKTTAANFDDNDIQPESSIIIGGGNSNLSPDAGKPLI